MPMRFYAVQKTLLTCCWSFSACVAFGGECGSPCGPAPSAPDCARACMPPVYCCRPCVRPCCCLFLHHHCAPYIPQYIPGPVTAVVGTQTVLASQAVVPALAAPAAFSAAAFVPTFAVASPTVATSAAFAVPVTFNGAAPASASAASASGIDNATLVALLQAAIKAEAARGQAPANSAAEAAAATGAPTLEQRVTSLEAKLKALTTCLQNNLAD